jgi:polysaccharide deacetylase 2 family uncharacterized protein YibQ
LAPSFSKNILLILSILLPLAAILAAGAALYFRQQAHPSSAREIGTERSGRKAEAKPEDFTAGLDSVLTVFLADFGVGAADIKRRNGNAGIHRIFTVNVPATTSLTLLHLKVRDLALSRGGAVLLGVEAADGHTLTLTLGADAKPTDVLIFKKVPGLEVKPAVAAIIIDDVGERDVGEVRKLCRLNLPLTLSIMPFRRFTSGALKLAGEEKVPYLLHMPMEPKLSSEDPGEGAILAGDPEAIIHRKLDRAFAAVKGAGGMNNHMGSQATEDRRAMEFVADYLRENGLFVVDSRTSTRSVLFEVAQRNKVKCASMTGYIDVINARDCIRQRLKELADAALEGKPVIIIGHDRTSTLDVLEKELPLLSARGIRLVPVADVVR